MASRAALLSVVGFGCVLGASGCEILDLFESHEPRVPADEGTLVLRGRIDPPFSIKAEWDYRTVSDTRSCRSLFYNFATGNWQGHHRRFSAGPAEIDEQGNYRLALEFKVPNERKRCQWYRQGPRVFLGAAGMQGAIYVGAYTQDPEAPREVTLHCYIHADSLGELGRGCEPSQVEFWVPELRGGRAEVELNVELIAYPRHLHSETGFEDVAKLLDGGVDAIRVDASSPRGQSRMASPRSP